MRWLIAVGVLLLVAACGPTTYSWDASPRLPRGGDHSSFRAVPGSGIEVVTPVGEIVDDANDVGDEAGNDTGSDAANDAGQDVAGDHDAVNDEEGGKDVAKDDGEQDAGKGEKDEDAGKGEKDEDAGKGEKDEDAGKGEKDEDAGKGEKDEDAGKGEKDAEVCGGRLLVNHTDMDAEAWGAYLAGWAGYVEQSPPNPRGDPAFDVMCKLDGTGAPRFLKAYGEGYVEWFNAAAAR